MTTKASKRRRSFAGGKSGKATHPSYGSSSLSLSLSYSTTDDNGDASSAASSESTAEAQEPTVIHELAATESLAEEESSISNNGDASSSISVFDAENDAASLSQSPASTEIHNDGTTKNIMLPAILTIDDLSPPHVNLSLADSLAS